MDSTIEELYEKLTALTNRSLAGINQATLRGNTYSSLMMNTKAFSEELEEIREILEKTNIDEPKKQDAKVCLDRISKNGIPALGKIDLLKAIIELVGPEVTESQFNDSYMRNTMHSIQRQSLGEKITDLPLKIAVNSIDCAQQRNTSDGDKLKKYAELARVLIAESTKKDGSALPLTHDEIFHLHLTSSAMRNHGNDPESAIQEASFNLNFVRNSIQSRIER